MGQRIETGLLIRPSGNQGAFLRLPQLQKFFCWCQAILYGLVICVVWVHPEDTDSQGLAVLPFDNIE